MPCCIKSGQQRLAAGRKNFIFFLCPLDGVQISFPSLPFISVISVTHLVSGFSVWKSRFKRSSDFLASLSAFVIPFGLRLGGWLIPIAKGRGPALLPCNVRSVLLPISPTGPGAAGAAALQPAVERVTTSRCRPESLKINKWVIAIFRVLWHIRSKSNRRSQTWTKRRA